MSHGWSWWIVLSGFTSLVQVNTCTWIHIKKHSVEEMYPGSGCDKAGEGNSLSFDLNLKWIHNIGEEFWSSWWWCYFTAGLVSSWSLPCTCDHWCNIGVLSTSHERSLLCLSYCQRPTMLFSECSSKLPQRYNVAESSASPWVLLDLAKSFKNSTHCGAHVLMGLVGPVLWLWPAEGWSDADI